MPPPLNIPKRGRAESSTHAGNDIPRKRVSGAYYPIGAARSVSMLSETTSSRGSLNTLLRPSSSSPPGQGAFSSSPPRQGASSSSTSSQVRGKTGAAVQSLHSNDRFGNLDGSDHSLDTPSKAQQSRSLPIVHPRVTLASQTQSSKIRLTAAALERPARLEQSPSVARLIYEQLELSELITCTPREHETADVENKEKMQGSVHYGLEETHVVNAKDDSFDEEEGENDFDYILNRQHFRPSLTSGYSRHQYPTAQHLRELFTGLKIGSEGENTQKMICLEENELNPKQLPTEYGYDIDSGFLVLKSMLACKQGLSMYLMDRDAMNIKTDVHFELDLNDEEVPTAQPRHIPHTTMFDVPGWRNIVLHIFFPSLMDEYKCPEQEFHKLTPVHFKEFSDNVLKPARSATLSDLDMQSFPNDYDHGIAKASGKKMTANRNNGLAEPKSNLGYHIKPEVLGAFWQSVLHHTEMPKNRHFANPILMASFKGFKLDLGKNHPLEALDFFEKWSKKLFDMRYVVKDEFYYDPAQKVCCTSDPSNMDTQIFATYLPRLCCIDRRLEHLTKHFPKQITITKYQLHHLAQATTVTFFTKPGSKLRKEGLVSGQIYASCKELFDCVKAYPFGSDTLGNLVVSESSFRAQKQTKGKSGATWSYSADAFHKSKSAVHMATTTCDQKNYGYRVEFRGVFGLWSKLTDIYREENTKGRRLKQFRDHCPDEVRAVSTADLADFVAGNVNKYAAVFEMASELSAKGEMSWSQSQFRAMILQCLRSFVSGTQLNRYPQLWKYEHETAKGFQYRGLDFQTSIRTGFCWLPDIVDWDRLEFLEGHGEKVNFARLALKPRQNTEALNLSTMMQKMDFCYNLLENYGEMKSCRHAIFIFMARLCLAQYRLDVMDKIRDELPAHYFDSSDRICKDLAMSFDEVSSAIGGPIHLQSGHKTKYKNIALLVEYLWGHGTVVKGHRNHLPQTYRQYAKTVDTKFPNYENDWRFVLYREFVATNWVIPAANSNQGMMFSRQTDNDRKKGLDSMSEKKRSWISIDEGDKSDGTWLGRWRWVAATSRQGSPKISKAQDLRVESLVDKVESLYSDGIKDQGAKTGNV